MRRVRIGIIGAGAVTEWALLPALSGPDSLTPPDSGAWWGRRPGAHSEIQYEAPVQPDVVALCDADGARARRVGETARVRAVYEDWRQMLREVPLDALLCAAGPHVNADVLSALALVPSPRHLWLDGPPAVTAAAAAELRDLLANSGSGQGLHLRCARPVRQSAAHRTAWRLMERGTIGPVAALSLRWGSGFFRMTETPANGTAAKPLSRDDTVSLSSTFAAVDLLLGFAGGFRSEHAISPVAVPVSVLASERSGATNLWLRFADGAGAQALFVSAENWSSPLPRLEICGTEGRSIVCEGGRRLWLHEPREAARMWEPPGLALQLSAANLAGVVEDVKAFLATCVEDEGGAQPDDVNLSPLTASVRALQVMEAAARSMRSCEIVKLDSVDDLSVTVPPPSPKGQVKALKRAHAKLPLSFD